MYPRITIVTPSFNQASYLCETIESVLAQHYPNLEYFVMDGGSTDGSVEVLREYASRLTYWESVPDGGQSDAIAKGFRRATGDLLNWLNSDDLLAPGALHLIAEMYRRHPDAGVYATAVENFSGDVASGVRQKLVPANIDLPSLLLASGRSPIRHQPGIFFTRAAYYAAGGISPRYHFCMDIDLHARLLESGMRVIYDSQTTAYFRQHATAKTRSVRNVAATVREYVEIADTIGRRTGFSPKHHLHLRTLAGAAVTAVRRGSLSALSDCVVTAMRIATNIATEHAIAWGKR